MRALVTGGAGFIGHHLVRGLLDTGWDVAVVDDYATGHPDRLTDVLERIELVVGDIRDTAVLDRVMPGTDVVFHEAAIPSVGRSIANPRRTSGVNIDGTIEVMLAAGRAGVKRVVSAGSSSVYGNSAELPRRETQRPEPCSPYAASKLAAEHFVHALGRLHGVETVVLRYFNVYGPGQDPDSPYSAVVPRFITAVLRGVAPVINGDGRQSRDFTYVDDVVAANLLAASVPEVSGLTCNVGAGGRYDLFQLLDGIAAAVGREVTPEFGAPRPADVPHSQADISLARERLGFAPAVDLHEGIRRTVAWFRAREAGQPRDDADATGAGVAVG